MNRLSLSIYIREGVSSEELRKIVGEPLTDKPDFYALKRDLPFFITGNQLGDTDSEKHTFIKKDNSFIVAPVVKVQPLFTINGDEDFWDLENITEFIERKWDQFNPFPINEIFLINADSSVWRFLKAENGISYSLSNIFWTIVEKASPEIYKAYRHHENIPVRDLRLYASFNVEENV